MNLIDPTWRNSNQCQIKLIKFFFFFFLLRALMGVVQGLSAGNVLNLVNTSGVNLIMSDLLSQTTDGRPVHLVCLLRMHEDNTRS